MPAPPPGRLGGFGRKKGTPNKKRTIPAVIILERLKFNVLEEMIARYRDPSTSQETKDRMLVAIAPYQYPRFRQVAVSLDPETVETCRLVIKGV